MSTSGRASGRGLEPYKASDRPGSDSSGKWVAGAPGARLPSSSYGSAAASERPEWKRLRSCRWGGPGEIRIAAGRVLVRDPIETIDLGSKYWATSAGVGLRF